MKPRIVQHNLLRAAINKRLARQIERNVAAYRAEAAQNKPAEIKRYTGKEETK